MLGLSKTRQILLIKAGYFNCSFEILISEAYRKWLKSQLEVESKEMEGFQLIFGFRFDSMPIPSSEWELIETLEVLRERREMARCTLSGPYLLPNW